MRLRCTCPPTVAANVVLRTDYTHIIIIGSNELRRLFSAFSRYTLGGEGYVDPVAFENVFEVEDGVPSLTFEPMITVRGSSARAATRSEPRTNVFWPKQVNNTKICA